MSLSIGTRLEHYEVLGPLGAGGMGEVYRGLDTVLKREVALKVLPPQFAADAARLARFEREAQLLATLNHPHIAAIYGLHHVGDVHFLAMELVEGPTLAERLVTAPIEVVEALRLAAQIADAVSSAHDKGVVHRDLKPANIKLTAEGKVKVLDLGLAKALNDAEPALSPDDSPTIADVVANTRAGTVLGTAAYMSPEQARGKPTDKRSDVWSFGVVLYEMLSRRKAFDGPSVSHVMVRVLEEEPDWTMLPAAVPQTVRDILEQCLQKEPSERLRDIGDVRLQLTAAARHLSAHRSSAGSAAAATPASAVGQRRPSRFAWALAAAVGLALLAVAAAAVWLLRRPAPDTPEAAFTFEIAQPNDAAMTEMLTLSPDGKTLAFLAQTEGMTRLWVRSLETLVSRPIAGTDSASSMLFWSPDGQEVVFFARGKLQRVSVNGGPPRLLAEVRTNVVMGGFWTRDDRIVFALGPVGDLDSRGLRMVPAAGGTPVAVTTLKEGEQLHGLPYLLPDERSFVYTVGLIQNRDTATYVRSLDAPPGTPPVARLMTGVVPKYAPPVGPGPAHLLFTRDGTLMAQAFDPGKFTLVGDPVPVAEGVPQLGHSASASGVLAYRTGGARAGAQLTWFDRDGRVVGTAGDPGLFTEVVISDDGGRVAFARADEQARDMDLWIYELARGVTSRFTFAKGTDRSPVWSADGSRIVYTGSAADGAPQFFEKPSNGSGEPRLFFKHAGGVSSPLATDWSSDGRHILYFVDRDVWVLTGEDGQRRAIQLTNTTFSERAARFLPGNENYFSFVSDESGRPEVYVREFDPNAPLSGGKWMVSKDGGDFTRWRADGRELFYVRENNVMAVDITTTPSFQAGTPRRLFSVPGGPGARLWSVAPDGQRLLFPVPVGADSPAPYRVVLNWTSTLKR